MSIQDDQVTFPFEHHFHIKSFL